ncbi:MAG: hypothetical protein ABIQ06_07255 [Caldimonas sp.]
MNMPAGPMHVPLVRNGVLATAALVSLILLGVFYSVVAGAVNRAATERRATIQLEAAARAAADARFAARTVLAVQSQPRMPQRYTPRAVAYVRSAR